MVLYRDEPGVLSDQALGDTYLLASAAAELPPENTVGPSWPKTGPPPDHHARIYVACGVVAEQLGIHPDAALSRLRDHAYEHGQRLLEVADKVVVGVLRLDANGPPHP